MFPDYVNFTLHVNSQRLYLLCVSQHPIYHQDCEGLMKKTMLAATTLSTMVTFRFPNKIITHPNSRWCS